MQKMNLGATNLLSLRIEIASVRHRTLRQCAHPCFRRARLRQPAQANPSIANHLPGARTTVTKDPIFHRRDIAADVGLVARITPGSLSLLRNAANGCDWVHTSIVVAVDASGVTTNECNTNSGGSRNGVEI